MPSADPGDDAPRAERSGRNVLLASVLVAAAEVCALAWLLH